MWLLQWLKNYWADRKCAAGLHDDILWQPTFQEHMALSQGGLPVFAVKCRHCGRQANLVQEVWDRS